MPTEIAGHRGRYLLETELATGGVGTVFRARSRDTGERVAVKVLHPAPDEETRRRFEQEARLGETFNHVNVVRVLDHGRHDGRDFLVMELVEGESLADLAATGAVELEDAVSIVREVARAVEALHRHGIIHRDVKPGNIMIDARGRAILTDFGFAKDLNASVALTGEYVVGTPFYMAPEHARGVVAPSVNVYSLGVVLYELVCRRLPLKGADVKEQWRLLDEARPAPPRKIDPRVPRGLESVILRALEKAPSGATARRSRSPRRSRCSVPAAGGRASREGHPRAALAVALAPALLLVGGAIAYVGVKVGSRGDRAAPQTVAPPRPKPDARPGAAALQEARELARRGAAPETVRADARALPGPRARLRRGRARDRLARPRRGRHRAGAEPPRSRRRDAAPRGGRERAPLRRPAPPRGGDRDRVRDRGEGLREPPRAEDQGRPRAPRAGREADAALGARPPRPRPGAPGLGARGRGPRARARVP